MSELMQCYVLSVSLSLSLSLSLYVCVCVLIGGVAACYGRRLRTSAIVDQSRPVRARQSHTTHRHTHTRPTLMSRRLCSTWYWSARRVARGWSCCRPSCRPSSSLSAANIDAVNTAAVMPTTAAAAAAAAVTTVRVSVGSVILVDENV